jgi:putative protease
MPIEEDEHGTYILNSERPARHRAHVQRLVDIGVDSLKIEGRTKSPYYVARTCHRLTARPSTMPWRAARSIRVLAARTGRPGQSRLHRRLLRAPPGSGIPELPASGHSESNRSLYVGDVTAYADGWAEIEVKNRFAVGDRLEFVTPGGNLEVRIDAMQNRKGEPIDVAPGSGHHVRIPAPVGCEQAFVARFL